MEADFDATNPQTRGLVLALAESMRCSARIHVGEGHGLKPGMLVTIYGVPCGPRTITSVTATTCVVRASTLYERKKCQMRNAWRLAVRLWWRAWDAVAERVA